MEQNIQNLTPILAALQDIDESLFNEGSSARHTKHSVRAPTCSTWYISQAQRTSWCDSAPTAWAWNVAACLRLGVLVPRTKYFELRTARCVRRTEARGLRTEYECKL